MMNFRKKQLWLAITLTLLQSTAYALPTGGTIVSGDGAIANVGNIANITQSSDKMIINWEDFSIGNKEIVNFLQKNANNIVLNRVLGNKLSEINGKLNATGKIFLVNQNGVAFGGGSEVNVGGIAVSTKDITNENFNKGLYKFTGDSSKSIINNGTMNIAEGGYAALIAEAITNKGTVAFKGANDNNTVALGAGKTVTLSFDANQRISMVVNEAAVNAVIYNKQAIDTQGGQIFMTAKAANALQGNIVNTGSSLKANTIKMESGVISLLDANALRATEKTTLTAASEIRAGKLATDAAKFDTTGGVGFTKYNVINNINELQGVKDDLNGKYMLGSDIDASATVDWNEKQGFNPLGNSPINSFEGTLDGMGFTVDKLTINRPGTEFVGLFGYVGNDGVITNIGMTNSTITGWRNVGGLVGYNNGGSISDSYNTGTVSSTGDNVGGLVGYNNGGSISDSYNTGTVSGTGYYVGGLVGLNNGGSISGSYNTGTVTGNDYVDGLVGDSGIEGSISDSYNTGTVVIIKEEADANIDPATLKVFDMITTSNMQMLRSPIVQEEWNLEPDTERLNSLYVLPLELDYYVLEKAGRQYILD